MSRFAALLAFLLGLTLVVPAPASAESRSERRQRRAEERAAARSAAEPQVDACEIPADDGSGSPETLLEVVDDEIGTAAQLVVDPEGAAEDERVFRWIAAPFVLYAPETSVQFGLFGGIVWRPRSFVTCSEASTFGLSAFYSLRRQVKVDAVSNVFVADGLWQVENAASFEIFNEDFWGIGPDAYGSGETFDFHGIRSETTVTRHLRGPWYLSGEHRLRWYEVDDIEAGGILATHDIEGRRQDLAHGVGLSGVFDTRDRKSSTTRGIYLRAGSVGFPGFLASRRQWARFELDGRAFAPLWLDHVLAAQVWAQANTGSPGFQSLAKLGGAELMRGVFEGRWRDRLAWAAQVEYRAHIFWRFGAVAFFGVGDVAHDFAGFIPEPVKWSVGGGLRLALSPEEGVYGRFDVGYTPGDVGFYLAIGEAF